MTDDERAIRELIETWMDASEAGDTARVLDLMSDVTSRFNSDEIT